MPDMEKEFNLPSANTGEIIVGDNEKKEEKNCSFFIKKLF